MKYMKLLLQTGSNKLYFSPEQVALVGLIGLDFKDVQSGVLQACVSASGVLVHSVVVTYDL